MIRTLQTLLALVCLLVLAFVAAKANSAPLQEPDLPSQGAVAQPVPFAVPQLDHGRHCLVPGPQPGTHLQGQPFAYGFFGARPQPSYVFHRSSNGDWFQWSVRRRD